jgi:hypothetical protein
MKLNSKQINKQLKQSASSSKTSPKKTNITEIAHVMKRTKRIEINNRHKKRSINEYTHNNKSRQRRNNSYIYTRRI